MVDDPETEHLIRWSPAGDSFLGQSFCSSSVVSFASLTELHCLQSPRQNNSPARCCLDTLNIPTSAPSFGCVVLIERQCLT